MPALNPDVALIHAHRADMLGNVQVDGYRHMDADMARAARTVIVSAEQIVSPDEIAARPDRTMLPHSPSTRWWPPRTGRTRTSATVATGRTCGISTPTPAAAKKDGPAAGLRYVEENVGRDKRSPSFLDSGRPGAAGRAGRRRGGADSAAMSRRDAPRS